ncbi:MAG: DUF1572 family protein [Bacteroidota bacterium]
MEYLENTIKLLTYYKSLGERAMEQLNEEEIHLAPGDDTNSIAIIVKHLHGNMLSRWTNFLKEDGEKEWRKREEEFKDSIATKKELLEKWKEGWTCFLGTLTSLKADDLNQTVYIRNEGHSVLDAIQRQLAHYSYHIGQIVFLSKMIKGENWNTLSIPKGESKAYNEKKFRKAKENRHFTDRV